MMDRIVLVMVLCAWASVLNVIYFTLRWYLHNRRLRREPVVETGPVVVIEAVKGVAANYREHVVGLLHQDHNCYRVIFSLGDCQDPALAFLADYFGFEVSADFHSLHIEKTELEPTHLCGPGLQSVTILIAGPASHSSQKGHNLVRAYDLLEDQDQLLAWVDADAELSSHWLNDLLFPLRNQTFAASTGYRVLVPATRNWVAAITSVINSTILTLYGDRWRNSLWGGSMAMHREVFDKLDIRRFVHRCFSVDASVSNLLKKNKVPIFFAFGVLPTGRVDYTFKAMMAFARRQYMSPRFYIKFHILVAHLLLWGFLLALFYLPATLLIHPTAYHHVTFIALLAAILLRGGLRWFFIRHLLRRSEYSSRCLFLETLGTPLVLVQHLIIFYSAMVGNQVTWSGITYRIRGPFDVEVLNR